jgi:toxin HigB-1
MRPTRVLTTHALQLTLTSVSHDATLHHVIKNFQHKGLRQFFAKGSTRGISVQMAGKIRRVLDSIDAAEGSSDLMIPGYGTHQLKGDRKGTWAITITGNWRITFKFVGVDAVDVNLEDYHKG